MRIIRTPNFVLPARRKCPSGKIAAPLPRPFEFALAHRRPLAQLPVVMLLLRCSSRELTALIDDGRLRWVFNIASRDSARREARVLWQSVIELIGLCPPLNAANENEAAEFTRVMELILPAGRTLPPLPSQPQSARERVVPGSEVAKCFSCHSQHVINLVREESLHTLDERRGPKQSLFITRASLIKFLNERRIS
jgi:hypothetical protein